NDKAQVNGYTAADAPIVMPIETPGYAAAEAIKADDLTNEADNLLREVYIDGQLLMDDSLTMIRERAGW
ncbi:MAG: hypothetical protein ABS880_00055, partial [Psychrobacter alimentarius]